MAKTFELIANKGASVFYEGKLAKKIVAEVQNSPINPGILSLNDLKNYQAKAGNLICTKYRKKYNICSMPLPSSGGVTLLQILGILENFDFSKMQYNSPKFIHLVSEAINLAYADRNQYIGDVEDVPIAQMLNKEYLKSRSNQINLNYKNNQISFGKFNIANDNFATNPQEKEPPSTTHLSIVDNQGNCVAFTSSIEYYFGSALSVEGFLMNNHMTDFSIIPEINGKKVANRIEPNKYPRSSMSPTFIFDENNNLLMAIGSPGGPRIIQFTLKAIMGFIDFNLNVQQAINLPNFISLNSVIELEKGTILTKWQIPLKKMGHKVVVTEITSGLSGITTRHKINQDVKNAKYFGGVDPRRDGLALGN